VIAKIKLYYLLTASAIVVLAVLSVMIGAARFDLMAVLSDPEDFRLLTLSRLPRTLAALLAGASMAVSGVIMQLLVRNRFVEPGTTGTTEGAMLGLLAITLIAPAAAIFTKMMVASLAAVGSMCGFLAISRKLPINQPLLLPLVGLIYSGIIGAVTTFFAYQADLLQYLGTWLTGGFSGILAGRYELLWLAGVMTIIAYWAADLFSVAGLGQNASQSLGLNYRQVLGLGVSIVAMVTALVVVTVGVIPFVGLVVPNIVSRIMGDNLRQSLPVVSGMGAGLVLLSDIIGRVVRYPYEIPAGTVFGILGAAVFLWLLYGRKSHV
jgi:iron complex transport system permease protein